MAGKKIIFKTRKDVEKLKFQWEKDPCWDLEYTEGFEEYEGELRAFSDQKKAEWKAAAEKAKKREGYKFNELQLHETMLLATGVWVMKVRTGWIYGFPPDSDNGDHQHVFVPFEL